MADNFNMSDVFISYSRKDSAFAHKLYDSFKALNKEVWVDFEDIPLTADWWQEIQAGINAAETFIFVLTPDSVRSDICRQEIEHAVQANKRLVPILHREIEEDADKARVHQHISSHNWIFFRELDDYDAAFKKLLSSVETDLEHNRSHTRLLVRAKEWDDSNRKKAYLLRDDDLRQAEEWLTQGVSKSPSPTGLHAEYIAASRNAHTQRQRNTTVGVTIALGVAIALTIFAVFQWRDAQVARQSADIAKDQAQRSAILARSLALSAYTEDVLGDEKPDLAMSLALEAVKIDPRQPQVLRALRDAAYAPGTSKLIQHHEGAVWDVDYNSRGDMILSGSADHNACLFDAREGELLTCLGEDGDSAHSAEVIAVEFLPDGMRAVTADTSGVLNFWQTDRRSEDFGRLIKSQTFEQGITAIKVYPDSSAVLVGFSNGLIMRWSIDSGEIQRFQRAHLGSVTSIDISPDNKTALSGGNDDNILLWNLKDGTWRELLKGHNDNVLSVKFSPDGHLALSGGQDNTFILWDVMAGEIVFSLEGHDSGVSDVSFGPTANQITTASWDNSIRIWDINTHKMLREFHGHTGGINRIDLTDDGQFMVSGAFDTNIRLWETHSFIQVGYIPGDTSPIQYLAYSPDGKFIATAQDSTYVHLWDAENSKLIRTLRGHTDRVVSVAISPESDRVAAISASNNMIVWDLTTGEQILNIHNIAPRLYMVLFGKDNNIVYVGLRETIRWWDISTGEVLGEVPYGGTISGNNALAISPDGNYLLAGLRGVINNLTLVDLRTGELVHQLDGHTDGILSAAFALNGQLGVTGSWDNTVRVWDLNTGELMRTLVAHTERVSTVGVSPDGKWAISGSNDRTMRLWNLERGSEEYEFEGHTDRVQAVAFSPDGRHMITGSIDGTAIIWRQPHPLQELIGWIHMNRFVPELSCAERDSYQVEPYCAVETAST